MPSSGRQALDCGLRGWEELVGDSLSTLEATLSWPQMAHTGHTLLLG